MCVKFDRVRFRAAVKMLTDQCKCRARTCRSSTRRCRRKTRGVTCRNTEAKSADESPREVYITYATIAIVVAEDVAGSGIGHSGEEDSQDSVELHFC